MSIQSLLAANRQTPVNDGQHANWSTDESTPDAAKQDSAPNGQPSSSKRKLEDEDSEDNHAKMRRTVQRHVTEDQGRFMNMTTVICLHAAVAQKSYGSEKRFLCPPPLVRIEGPFGHMRDHQLSMSIVSESGDKSPEQKAPIDSNMMASFKFLHVTGTAKAKSFQLSLEIAQPPPPAMQVEGVEPRPARMWATFESAPVTIISKPSKKTAKTRNIASCILAGGPVSLFNRINSQTVRTKYMTIDHAHLCASNISWSAFNVNVLRRPADATTIAGPQPVTYGCEIVLSDSLSGIATAPLIIRKVDKGKISAEDGGPVSQMQKIALQRVNPDGSRHYLSAAGPMPGTPGVVAPPAPGVSSQAGTHHLLFQSARVREEMKDGVRVVTDEVDDYLCWTIVGISKFQYTFFDALGNNNIPEMPITPFPTLFTAPVYRPTNHQVELTVSNFFYENPKTGQHSPLEVWLGDIGPLNQQVYRTSPPGPLTNISSFVHNNSHGPILADGSPGQIDPSAVAMSGDPPIAPAPRYMPPGPLHTIVIVDMPPISDIVKTLQGDANRLQNGHPTRADGKADGEASSSHEVPTMSIAGRTLPLLFIRGVDGIGYHSGRTIACESIFQGIDLHNASTAGPNAPDAAWLAAATQAAASTEGGMHGWTLRVL
ncbi:hypothetical protein BD410DRAFT_811780 [Rickenella mellea]|uniref:Beta-trefoil n=1 Tax=Rickenella mellea TaxID=50990 RepID=A0A4Y7QMW6_9AGAM|nr:hypothetical protein BD410DRAFT_811780 [Rickenella mellea]